MTRRRTQRIQVSSTRFRYPVVLHRTCLRVGRVPNLLRADGGRIALITDRRVAGHHLDRVRVRLQRMGFFPQAFLIRPGERSKTLPQVLRLAREMLAADCRRSTPVLALGGGVVGDLAGLLASLYMRGVPLVQVPTTLLAQVDSSIGGKTGVDLPEGKNLLGTYWPPAAVWTWPGFLGTLPPPRVREGLAEILKYGYVADPRILDLAGSIDPRAPLRDPERMEELIALAIGVKARVVSQDEREGGLRQILNFGHTLGHAIERRLGFSRFTHGEAIALGMRLALRIGERLGVTEPGLARDLDRRLEALGLPTRLPAGVEPSDLVEAARHDKKRVGSIFRLILVRRPGEPLVHPLGPERLQQLVEAAI